MQDAIELGWVSHPQQPELKPLFRTELAFMLLQRLLNMMRDRKEKAKVSTGSQGFQGLLYIVIHSQRFSYNTRRQILRQRSTVMTVVPLHPYTLEGALIPKVRIELLGAGCWKHVLFSSLS